MIDDTHHPAARSWVDSANGHPDFPIQNLPMGVFEGEDGQGRIGVAIGDSVLDLRAAVEVGFFVDLCSDAMLQALLAPTLNAWMALRPVLRENVRGLIFGALDATDPGLQQPWTDADRILRDRASLRMRMPAAIGDYTDFYAGIRHATNVGRLFRPDSPLLPNYRHVPIGYHGRASSIVVSGTPLRRPHGQLGLDAGAAQPRFGPCARLDHELELAIWVGPGNGLGSPVPIGEAALHIAGYGLLNDWSARDIQAWEYQPLGPFLGKNFMSSVSPWVVTTDALAPFRLPRAARGSDEPQPLAYLDDAGDAAQGGLAIELEVTLSSAAMRAANRAAMRLARVPSSALYWTPAQLLAHHTVGGCNLAPGDLFGSGTISGETPDAFGSLLEITQGGRVPLTLPGGETRTFLEAGDEIVFRAHARRDGATSIGFGECRGIVID